MYIVAMAAAPNLTPSVFSILLSLADGERHGYAIMKDARTPQGGGVSMGPGTLYGTLERLMRDGYVVESTTSQAAEGPEDQRRRYYRLTDAGREALNAELLRMDAALTGARERGLLAAGGRS